MYSYEPFSKNKVIDHLHEVNQSEPFPSLQVVLSSYLYRLPRTNMPCPLLARSVVYWTLDRSQEAAQIAIGEGERPLPFIVIVQLGHVRWRQKPIESRRIERPKNGEEVAVSLVHGGLTKRRHRALNPLHVAVADLVA